MRNLKVRPFIKALQQVGKVYKVGGVVRDSFLNKESKDLDILVCGVSIDKIIELLQPHGDIDLVGKIFGVLKFQDGVFGEVDIAIPRTERLMTPLEILNVEYLTGEKLNPHKAFILDSDPYLPIEDDLRRRDFTINSMALDLDDNLIDPYNGHSDLINQLIRCTNDQSFIDDPLRMKRAIRFASVLGFKIEEKTLKSIKDNASNIKGISKERILIELDKIYYKGYKKYGVRLLKETGLFEYIFENNQSIDNLLLENCNSISEFYYLLLSGHKEPEVFYLNTLKGDKETAQKIKALNLVFTNNHLTDNLEIKKILCKAYSINDIVTASIILPDNFISIRTELIQNLLPFHRSELVVNGNDLKVLGLSGKAIGDLLEEIHILIIDYKLKNLKDDIISWVKSNI